MERERSSTKLTYADYVALPDDDLRHEIIDGEHYVTPSPVTRHQRISRNLLHLIQTYLDTNPLGEIFYAPLDALLSEFDIVVPDLLYLSRERARFLTEKNLQGPPDFVIEILSPSTRSRDERLKRDLYERVGVQEYWLVNPLRDVIHVYRLDETQRFTAAESYARGDLLTTRLLPGLQLAVDSVLGPIS